MTGIEFVRMQDLARELGVSRSTLRRWKNRPDFPRFYRLGPATPMFRRDEVRAWIDRLQEKAA